MQVANILLSLGGDTGNQVVKHDITPSEVAVLRIIHGESAVTEVEPTGDVARSNKAERERLIDIYAKIQPDGTRRSQPVDMLFPGVAAQLYQTFDELELPDEFYKAETRVRAKPIVVARPVAQPEPVKAKGGRKKKDALPEPEAEVEDLDDEMGGIGEIHDKFSKSATSFE